jgi:hypothetical protein
MNRAYLAGTCVLITVACGGDKTLPIPTTSTSTAAFGTFTSVVVQGPAPTIGPGQTAQVKAVARFSDGTERDVSTDATWASSQPQIATVNGGMIKGQALGRTVIRATYMSRTASLTIVVEPEGTFVVSGNITEPGSLSVGMATVAVLGGPLNSVTANGGGFYELFGVSGTVTLRVSSPRYLDETRTLTVTQDQKLNVEIRPIVGPTPVAGTYRMTLKISPSCSIVPDDQKTRMYTATIGQDGARLTIQLSDANFVRDSRAEKSSFSGRVSGSTVTFDWGSGYYVCYYGASVQETLPGGQILGIWGTMVATAAQTISGNLVGGFTFREGNRTSGCSAADNGVAFTRK